MSPPYNCITNVLAAADVDSWFPSTVIPVVADDTARDAMFPSPQVNQRVRNLKSAEEQIFVSGDWRKYDTPYLIMDDTGCLDVHAVIQHAIDAAYARGGGPVRIAMPQAFYRVKCTLVVPSGVHIIGDARTRPVPAADPMTTMIYFDPTASGDGFHLDSPGRVVLSHITMQGFEDGASIQFSIDSLIEDFRAGVMRGTPSPRSRRHDWHHASNGTLLSQGESMGCDYRERRWLSGGSRLVLPNAEHLEGAIAGNTVTRRLIGLDSNGHVVIDSDSVGARMLGGTSYRFQNINMDTTVGWSNNGLLVDATGGARTITLPDATTVNGLQIFVKKKEASGNAVTVTTTGVQTIDGAADVMLAAQYSSVVVRSDGAQWWIVA